MAKGTTRRRKTKKPASEKNLKPGRPIIGRAVVYVTLCALIAAGIATRVHFLDRSLWLDEAWVANSMRAESLREAIYYEDWLQTSPPLFIALGRFFTMLFGTSNVAFRIVPAFSGVIAVMLLAFLAFRLLTPSFALLALMLFVVSPRAILYSQSVKQYSTDILATISLLTLGQIYLENYSSRSFYSLLAGVVLLSFLSYPAMLFFPFVLCGAFSERDVHSQTDDERTKIFLHWPRGALVIGAALLVVLANHFLFIIPNKNEALAEFFHEGYYPGTTLAGWFDFYGAKLSTITEVFFFGGLGPLRVFALMMTIFGCFCLWAPLYKSFTIKTMHTAVLFTAPFAGIIVLNSVGAFPLPGFQHRVLLFAFPVTVLLFGLGLQSGANFISQFLSRRFSGLNAAFLANRLGVIVFFVMASLAGLFFTTDGLTHFFAEEHEESERAVAFLRDHVETNDVLYVHATMREQFKLYTWGKPVPTNRVIDGKIGMPCCPRRNYRQPQQESEKDVSDEMMALSATAGGERLWVIVTNRGLHEYHVGRSEVELLERGLARQGCQRQREKTFVGVYVAAFGCPQK